MKRLQYAAGCLFALALTALLAVPAPLGAQATGQVTGTVTSETGGPLSGASVSVLGTASGALTGPDGRYTISGVQPGERTLRATLIGYAEQTATVTITSGQVAQQNFQLTSQALELEGVVAVGYGTQRRVTVTGAVASVSTTQLESRPIATVEEALAGATPGLTVIQRSSQPGEQGIQFNIRGRGSIENSTQPLVLIDGIEGDIEDLNPLDIEAISVLKDASSAAIYGSRAANGVILVTTKRGTATGGLQVSYDGRYGVQGVGTMPKAIGPRDYLSLINEALVNANLPPRYTQEYIDNTVRAQQGDPGVDPVQYPWTDWIDVLYDPAPIMDHTVGVAGGNEVARFNLSLNYFDQEGMLANTGAERYGLRLNTDYTLTDRLTAGADLALRQQWYIESNNQDQVYFRAFHDTPPTVMARYPDGTYGWSRNNHNPLAYAEAWGTLERTTLNGTLTGKLDYELLDGLAIRTQASVQEESWDYDNWRNQAVFRDYFDPGITRRSIDTNFLDRRKSNTTETYLRGLLDFNRLIGVHNVAATLGYDQTQFDWDEIRADRTIFYSNELQEINAGDAARDNNWGNSEAWRLRSGFGRLSYGFDDRYLLEFNARYDGSSRFAEGNRFGFFPSISAGWRISQEPFFNVPWVDELKIRGSWGEMGNQNIGLYRYFSSIALGQTYLLGNELQNGAAKIDLANRDISWETTEMTDIGLDLQLFNGRLSFTGDIYRKLTTGNLIELPIPDIIGLGEPTQNAASIENRGWEAAINWQDSFRDGGYALGFNISDNKNEVLDLRDTGPFIDGLFIIEEGLPLGTMWAYEADGLFVDQAEVDAHADQQPLTGPGDIKFVDQNNDNVINADDRVVVGNDLPRYTIGSNVSASWRGFDASMFFQGVLKVDAYLEGALVEGPVWENFTTSAWLDHWTEEDPDPNARMPKPALQVHHNFGDRSSFWVQDASYVKLRNAQLGFTLPESVTGRLNVDRMRIYLSGENLLTFSEQDLLLDPEFPTGRGTVYPQMRTISFGTSIGF